MTPPTDDGLCDTCDGLRGHDLLHREVGTWHEVWEWIPCWPCRGTGRAPVLWLVTLLHDAVRRAAVSAADTQDLAWLVPVVVGAEGRS